MICWCVVTVMKNAHESCWWSSNVICYGINQAQSWPQASHQPSEWCIRFAQMCRCVFTNRHFKCPGYLSVGFCRDAVILSYYGRAIWSVTSHWGHRSSQTEWPHTLNTNPVRCIHWKNGVVMMPTSPLRQCAVPLKIRVVMMPTLALLVAP